MKEGAAEGNGRGNNCAKNGEASILNENVTTVNLSQVRAQSHKKFHTEKAKASDKMPRSVTVK